MSNDDHTDDGQDGAGEDLRGYDEMLATLDALLDEAMRKVESGRVYDAENERVRIKWIRVATQVVDTRRKVQTDRDLDELSERLEELERAQEADALAGVAPGEGRP